MLTKLRSRLGRVWTYHTPGSAVLTGAIKVVIETASLISTPSFLDYIRGGCELAFIVAIDFTASKYVSPEE